MTADTEDLAFDTQIKFWGAHWSGQVVEVDANVAEGQMAAEGFWDRDTRYLESMRIWSEDGPKTPPEWWALPHVATMLIQNPEMHDAL